MSEAVAETKGISEELKRRSLNTAKKHACDLLKTHFDKIWDSFDETCTDTNRSYNISLAINLKKPKSDEIKVNGRISYGVRNSDSTEPDLVTMQGQFDFEEDETQAESVTT